MELFFLFLLVVFFIFVVRPLFKLWRTYSKLKKGDFSVFGDLFGQPGSQKQTSAYGTDGHRKAGWTKARIKKKKIPADVGEYVKFTEITTAEESRTTTEQAGADGNQSTVTVEQQITDVEWEDIK
jgi:hypothetical protein